MNERITADNGGYSRVLLELSAAQGDAVCGTGYPAAFALTGTLTLAALVPVARDR